MVLNSKNPSCWIGYPHLVDPIDLHDPLLTSKVLVVEFSRCMMGSLRVATTIWDLHGFGRHIGRRMRKIKKMCHASSSDPQAGCEELAIRCRFFSLQMNSRSPTSDNTRPACFEGPKKCQKCFCKDHRSQQSLGCTVGATQSPPTGASQSRMVRLSTNEEKKREPQNPLASGKAWKSTVKALKQQTKSQWKIWKYSISQIAEV